MLTPTAHYFIHNCSDNCQTAVSPDVQNPVMVLICTSGFSTSDQLSTC